MYAILEYREWDGETTPHGPYDSSESAWEAAQRRATELVNERTRATGARIVDRIDSVELTVLVYDLDYEDSEPTDDEHYVSLGVVPMHRLI